MPRWPARRGSTVRRALRVLERVEATTPMLPTPSPARLVVGAWSATRIGAPAEWLARLPGDDREEEPPDGRDVRARTSAATVRIAKLGDPAAVRARAFYLAGDGRPMSVKVVAGRAGELARIQREVDARREIGASLPAPTILDAGRTGDAAYIVESVVFGDHPRRSRQKQALALRLVDDLLAFHRSRGVADGPFDVHPETAARLARLFTTPWARSIAEAGSVDPDALAASVAAVTSDGRAVPVGWGHGDLGFSNVIVADDDSPVIVDWEHAGRMPAITDLAKLAVMAPRPVDVVGRILAAATPADLGDRAGRMPLRGQLAAVVVRELSWWESRRDRATTADRIEPFERGIGRRFRLLAHLVGTGRTGG